MPQTNGTKQSKEGSGDINDTEIGKYWITVCIV